MRLFGLEITKAGPSSLSPVFGQGGGWLTIFDSSTNLGERDRPPGSFQQARQGPAGESVLSFNPVYACITLIANDMGKLRQCLMEQDSDGVLQEVSSAAFSPVLRKPNRYQNHIQFKQWWTMSKLDSGNTYALKERDNRGMVIALYILHPRLCKPLVAPDGSVYYQLGEDNLSGVQESVIVPASEIIHDRMNCLFHPLVGTSPLYAAALAAQQGLGIQTDSLTFFANGSSPGGVLTAPGAIGDATAARAKAYWEQNYAGRANTGKVAVLGDGLKYEPMRMTSVDSQVSEQLNLSAKFICSSYHVPPFKVGLGDIPVGQKVSDLNQIYYDDCLQSLIEEYELCLMEGLALRDGYSISLDLDGLLRMDPASQIEMLGVAVDKTLMKPNEARKRLNLGPVDGGDTLYKQQQNYSLSALAKRDAKDNPFGTDAPPPAPPAESDTAKELLAFVRKQTETDAVEEADTAAQRKELTDRIAGLSDEVITFKKTAGTTQALLETLALDIQAERDARLQAQATEASELQKQAADEQSAHDFADALIKRFAEHE